MQMQRTLANTEVSPGIDPRVVVQPEPDFFRQTISSKQSLECVQTLLKAGLGCISYLRCIYYGPPVLISS